VQFHHQFRYLNLLINLLTDKLTTIQFSTNFLLFFYGTPKFMAAFTIARLLTLHDRDESSPHLIILSVRSALILSSHIRTGLQIYLSCAEKNCTLFLPTCAMFPDYLALFNVFINFIGVEVSAKLHNRAVLKQSQFLPLSIPILFS
jgi:hypothetical protein